jgi:hypothetical protein
VGAQIANLESGRKRGLDVAELLVLAAALDVPPVTLLFPGLPDADTEKLPGQTVSAVAAMLWFTGEYADSDLGRLLKLSRDRLLKQAQHKAATELMEGFAAKAASDAEIERAAAMIRGDRQGRRHQGTRSSDLGDPRGRYRRERERRMSRRQLPPQAAGVRPIRLHDARHSRGTALHLRGVPLAVIAKWLGSPTPRPRRGSTRTPKTMRCALPVRVWAQL